MNENSTDSNENSPPIGSERSFGLLFAAVFAIVAIWLWFSGALPHSWFFGVAALFALSALLFPAALRPLNFLWFKFGLLLHALVSPVVLAIMFFLVITPTGLIMKLCGKRFLGLGKEQPLDSYWIAREASGPNAESMKNQF